MSLPTAAMGKKHASSNPGGENLFEIHLEFMFFHSYTYVRIYSTYIAITYSKATDQLTFSPIIYIFSYSCKYTSAYSIYNEGDQRSSRATERKLCEQNFPAVTLFCFRKDVAKKNMADSETFAICIYF